MARKTIEDAKFEALKQAEQVVLSLRNAVSPNGPDYQDGIIDAVTVIRALMRGPIVPMTSDVAERMAKQMANADENRKIAEGRAA